MNKDSKPDVVEGYRKYLTLCEEKKETLQIQQESIVRAKWHMERTFGQWVSATLSSGPVLDARTYADLTKPSQAVAPFTYRAITPDLFNRIASSGSSPDDPSRLTHSESWRAEK